MRVLFRFFGDVWNVNLNLCVCVGWGGLTEERVPVRLFLFFCDFGLGV